MMLADFLNVNYLNNPSIESIERLLKGIKEFKGKISEIETVEITKMFSKAAMRYVYGEARYVLLRHLFKRREEEIVDVDDTLFGLKQREDFDELKEKYPLIYKFGTDLTFRRQIINKLNFSNYNEYSSSFLILQDKEIIKDVIDSSYSALNSFILYILTNHLYSDYFNLIENDILNEKNNFGLESEENKDTAYSLSDILSTKKIISNRQYVALINRYMIPKDSEGQIELAGKIITNIKLLNYKDRMKYLSNFRFMNEENLPQIKLLVEGIE